MKKEKEKNKNVVKKNISHEDYVDCLLEERKFMLNVQTIRSFKHQIYTIKQNKVPLSPWSDKRNLLDDGVSSLPSGHFSCCKYLRSLSVVLNYFSRNFCNVF